jgi:hypothetical protein
VDHAAFPLVVGGVVTLLATTFSLLPERLDVTHVFAAYGAGTIVGEALAARRRIDHGAMMRRWGSVFMFLAGLGRVSVRHTWTRMTPREDRRFRIALAIVLPLAGAVGWVASANDWGVGWVWLAFLALMAFGVVFVHYPPWERSRRRR